MGRQLAVYKADDETTTDVDESERMFAGMFNGIPGMYTCAATGNDTCEASADNDGNLMSLTGTWTFTPDEYAADKYVVMGVVPDTDYLHFGYWLQGTEGDDGTAYKFQSFAGGADTFNTNNMSAVEGTATYAGPAGGMYVRGEVGSSTAGRFTADTKLAASFGGMAVPANDHYSISGTVENFMDGNMSLDGWTVKLNEFTFEDDASVTKGTTEGSARRAPGAWSIQFFGSSDAVGGVTPQPSGITGEFDANFTNGSVSSAFGAVKQE